MLKGERDRSFSIANLIILRILFGARPAILQMYSRPLLLPTKGLIFPEFSRKLMVNYDEYKNIGRQKEKKHDNKRLLD